MSFNEKPNLRDERTPLIQNPIVWTRSQEYNMESDYSFTKSKRKEQFQWMVFVGVTIISFFILLAIIGAAIKANEFLPPVVPRPHVPSTTTTTTTTGAPAVTASSTSTTEPPVPVVPTDATVNTNPII